MRGCIAADEGAYLFCPTGPFSMCMSHHGCDFADRGGNIAMGYGSSCGEGYHSYYKFAQYCMS